MTMKNAMVRMFALIFVAATIGCGGDEAGLRPGRLLVDGVEERCVL